MQEKDLGWLKKNLIAHRGLHTKDGSIPENSLASCKAAMASEYDIEIDINILKDNTVIVFHDHTLLRMTGDPRSLDEVTYEDIKDLRLSGSDEPIATLKEVLDLVKGRANLLIEFKPHGDVKKLCQAFEQVIKGYIGSYAVFSFHPSVVHWFRKHMPHVIRGQISEYFKDGHLKGIRRWMMKRMVFNRFTKPDFISYGIKDLPNKHLDRLKKRGMTILSYAAQNQASLDMVRTHYDNAVFEFFRPKK